MDAVRAGDTCAMTPLSAVTSSSATLSASSTSMSCRRSMTPSQQRIQGRSRCRRQCRRLPSPMQGCHCVPCEQARFEGRFCSVSCHAGNRRGANLSAHVADRRARKDARLAQSAFGLLTFGLARFAVYTAFLEQRMIVQQVSLSIGFLSHGSFLVVEKSGP